jgi:hypothetical protein
MDNPETLTTLDTQDKDKQSKKRLAPRTPSTNRGWTQMLSKGQQFPLLIRQHRVAHIYSQLRLNTES